MRKLFTICFIMATVFAVNAQELTKEETLNYIKEVYEPINEVWIASDSRYVVPLNLDSLQLKNDRLIYYFNYKKEKEVVIVAIISGDIIVSGSNLKNTSINKEFMHVQSGNESFLVNLKKAVIHLQKFITKDPFGN